MSAEILRRAAALMRERAEAATPGPWSGNYVPESAVANQHIIERWFVMGCFDGNPRNPTGPAAMCEYEPDAAHIASWHPVVALAVAEWLEATAAENDNTGALEFLNFVGADAHAALVVARAYLGESS